MDDKRHSARLSKYIPVMIEDSKVHMLFRANVGDISYEGMRVVASQFLPKGSTYTFSLKFTSTLVVKGEVRWIASTGRDTFRIGIHFIEMTPEVRETIQGVVDAEARKKVPQQRVI